MTKQIIKNIKKDIWNQIFKNFIKLRFGNLKSKDLFYYNEWKKRFKYNKKHLLCYMDNQSTEIFFKLIYKYYHEPKYINISKLFN